MDRKTRRDSAGKAFFKPADPDCGSCNNCDRLFCCMGRWAESLAAYEDTGLEPEEIDAVAGLASKNCSRTADAIGALLAEDTGLQALRASGLTPDELAEAAALLQAKREGRCVVLPCKPNRLYTHRAYETGELELNIELHDFDGDEKALHFEKVDRCAYWE